MLRAKKLPQNWISGTHEGYEYADLGLPSGTRWAIHNIGATAPEEYGDFFAWGEVEAKDWFVPENYQYHTGEIIEDHKYESFYECVDIGCNICGTEYDAASHLWGNGWRMLCGPNTNSIFIPAAGAGPEPGSQYECPEGRTAVLWLGEAYCDFKYNGVVDSTFAAPYRAYNITYDDGSYGKSRGWRYTGQNIRPVYNPKEATGISSISSSPKITIAYCEGKLYVQGLNEAASVRISDVSGRLAQSIRLDKSASMDVDLPYGFISFPSLMRAG